MVAKSRLPRWSAPAVAWAGALLLLAFAGFGSLDRRQARDLVEFGEAPGFTLTDQLGRTFNSDDIRGKVAIATFVYTSCTDICPLLSLQLQQLQERLRQDGLLGDRVQLLSFTVDPERDTPTVLRAYAERHRADPDAWRFLTGPKERIEPMVVRGFKLGMVALPPTSGQGGPSGAGAEQEAYEVMHSGRFVLIDRGWQIRKYYDGRELDPEQVLRDARALLR